MMTQISSGGEMQTQSLLCPLLENWPCTVQDVTNVSSHDCIMPITAAGLHCGRTGQQAPKIETETPPFVFLGQKTSSPDVYDD